MFLQFAGASIVRSRVSKVPRRGLVEDLRFIPPCLITKKVQWNNIYNKIQFHSQTSHFTTPRCERIQVYAFPNL